MSRLYDRLVSHVTTHQSQFYRAAYYYVKNREAALDVVQNAIVKGLENVDKLQSEEALPTGFYRILINEALMYLRKEKKYIAWDDTESDLLEGRYDEPAFEPGLEIRSRIEELPTQMQVIIQLHFFEEKTLKEIAEITDTNLNTVKSRLYAACRRLGKELEEEDETISTRYTRDKDKKHKKAAVTPLTTEEEERTTIHEFPRSV